MSKRLRKPLGWAGALLLLAGVFALYLQPEMMRTLADQLWACF